MNNHIAVQLRNNILIIPDEAKKNPARDSLAHATAANLLTYGILVNPEALIGTSAEYLTDLNNTARITRGADRSWDTLFPNFPEGVRKSKRLDLIVAQIVHYLSYGTLRPAQKDDVRSDLPVDEMLNGAVRVNVADSFDEAIDIAARNVNQNKALQADFVNFFVFVFANAIDTQKDALLDATKNAKFKENISLLHLGHIIATRQSNGNTQADARDAINQVVIDTIPTIANADVLLRLILSAYVYTGDYSSEDITEIATRIANLDSVARGTKTAPISNSVRSAIVNQLDKVVRFKEFPADVFLERKALWRRILSSVHAFSVASGKEQQYLLDVIFDNIEDYSTFYAVVEAGLAGKNTQLALDMLARLAPGLLLRKVIAFAERDFNATLAAVDSALSSKKVPVATLISAVNAVRASHVDTSGFLRIAGMTTQKIVTQARLSKAEASALEDVLVNKGLVSSLADTPAPTGTVAVGNGTMPVPLSLASRSNTVSDRLRLDQGERTTIDGKGSTLRMFVHWFNSEDNGYGCRSVDIDLGMSLFDENFNSLDAWSYDNVYSGYYRDHGVNKVVTFSGDSTDAPRPDGASEFYDVDMAGLKSKYPKGRYLVMSVTVYSGGAIDSIDHFAGVMRRDDTQSGQVFDARTVMSGSRSGVKSRLALPLAVDIDTSELIWLDTDTGMNKRHASVTGLQNEIGLAVKDIVNTDKVSVSEFMTLYANVHGVDVDRSAGVDMSQVASLL